MLISIAQFSLESLKKLCFGNPKWKGIINLGLSWVGNWCWKMVAKLSKEHVSQIQEKKCQVKACVYHISFEDDLS